MRGEERALGYARADTDGELEEEKAAIRAACEARGWRLLRLEEDEPGSRLGRARALAAVRSGEAGALVVASLSSLAASLAAAAKLLARAREEGWNLLALDLGLDLRSAEGKEMAERFLFVARW